GTSTLPPAPRPHRDCSSSSLKQNAPPCDRRTPVSTIQIPSLCRRQRLLHGQDTWRPLRHLVAEGRERGLSHQIRYVLQDLDRLSRRPQTVDLLLLNERTAAGLLR